MGEGALRWTLIDDSHSIISRSLFFAFYSPHSSSSSSCVSAFFVSPYPRSWYHLSFDTEPDIEHVKVHPPNLVMSDFKLCKWPEGLDPLDESVAAALDRLNDERQGWGEFLTALESGSERQRSAHLITFSHFLPRLELCPEKRMLFYPNLPKAVGSDYILRRIQGLAEIGSSAFDGGGGGEKRRMREHVHVFGHTHFGWDHTLDGIRYIQAPVSYPNEWKQRPGSLTVGPDTRGAEFNLSPQVWCGEEKKERKRKLVSYMLPPDFVFFLF